MQKDPSIQRSLLPRRFGSHNPERIVNPHWEWMIRHGMWPKRAREQLALPPDYHRPCYAGGDPDYPYGAPDWCFSGRYGQTRTRLSDGRVICIAGEHEDWYDLDFCIYNDVVVLRAAPGEVDVTPLSGEIEIYGYPEALFAPTDHHSASLVADYIYIVGGLGYAARRVEGLTPVLRLNTQTYCVEPVSTTGRSPGWIHRHHAVFDAASGTLTLRGGVRQKNGQLESNRSAYRLHVQDERWECIADPERHRFFVFQGPSIPIERYPIEANVFKPRSMECESIESDMPSQYKLVLDVRGVRVFVHFMHLEIRMAIEGELPEDDVNALVSHVQETVSSISEAKWTVVEVADCSYGWVNDISDVVAKVQRDR